MYLKLQTLHQSLIRLKTFFERLKRYLLIVTKSARPTGNRGYEDYIKQNLMVFLKYNIANLL
jgi:hypothetical protein